MPADPPPRIVTLVLVSGDGAVLGRLPAFPVDTPWWQDARPVVGGARARFGLDVSDPDRASSLLAPVAAARLAVIYQRFLDNIEPSEHPYHRVDVPDWLRRTADILRAE